MRDDGSVQLTIASAGFVVLATEGHTTATVVIPTPTPAPNRRVIALIAATAQLSATSLEIEPSESVRKEVSGSEPTIWRRTIDPEETGTRLITFYITLEYQTEAGDVVRADLPSRSEPVKVEKSLFTRGELNLTGLVTGMVGSGLSCPFLYTLWKDRRARARKGGPENAGPKV